MASDSLEPRRFLLLLLLLSLLPGWLAVADRLPSVVEVEAVYADAADAYGILGLIDSGLVSTYHGKDREAWDKVLRAKREAFTSLVEKVDVEKLSQTDARAIAVMRKTMESYAGSSLAPTGNCKDASRRDLSYDALRSALYACFAEFGNNIDFEGKKLNRVGALGLLGEIDEPARRKALFLSFVPLWQAINGAGQSDSPYRRMIAMAASDAEAHGSPIDAAARTLGISSSQAEAWLEQILEAWRQATGDQEIEPWDFRYQAGEADRELSARISRDSMEPIAEHYYTDLGANLRKLGVIYDQDARPGKAPLAYADFVTHGQIIDGRWRPTVVRVSTNNARGGLSTLNELVHENGHAVHMMAVHTRPAFMDLGDPVFYEAFADVASWSTYEPSWQKKYLGKSASEAASLRSLFSGVMLDVAWALFEARMLRHPDADPNAVWTEITHHYLHIAPHPELSWWAVRVQLVDAPGYMVNYGLGAVVTAEIRQRIHRAIGGFDTGNPKWYPWISRHLLRTGMEKETSVLLRDFLGRAVSAQPLIDDLKRMGQSK